MTATTTQVWVAKGSTGWDVITVAPCGLVVLLDVGVGSEWDATSVALGKVAGNPARVFCGVRG